MVERRNIQAFIFTRNPDLQFLILKRMPDRSGYWQPVCGGIEGNEETDEAVKREILEETGITEIMNVIDLEYSFIYEETKNEKLMKMQDICFAAEVATVMNIKLSDEHECYLWCSKNEVGQYLTWEHNLIAFEKLLKVFSFHLKRE